jgi:tRNA pseudouridine38-40 synthase
LAQRYFIQIRFKGTRFHGWQNQENATTVQETLEKSLSILLQKKVPVVGAGRTDTGVHADFFIAHFDAEEKFKDIKKTVYQLNRILPTDLAIHNLYPVKTDAHARYSAISRTYEYRIIFLKDPFENDYCLFLNHRPDLNLLNETSRLLLNYSDFSSFRKLHSDNKTNICTIVEAGWRWDKDKLIFRIKANRFLRDMVRAIVGTMLDVGFKKKSISDFIKIIEARNRQKAGTSAPAHALYLVDIEYPSDISI